MEILRQVPYDYVQANEYPDFPEFMHAQDLPNLVVVGEGDVQLGDRKHVFVSKNFLTCTAFVFSDEQLSTFGLMHVVQFRRLTGGHRLHSVANGKAIAIQGSGTIFNIDIRADIYHALGIEDIRRIQVDTLDDNGENHPFQVAFRPISNEILVARNSHKDLLVFKAF